MERSSQHVKLSLIVMDQTGQGYIGVVSSKLTGEEKRCDRKPAAASRPRSQRKSGTLALPRMPETRRMARAERVSSCQMWGFPSHVRMSPINDIAF